MNLLYLKEKRNNIIKREYIDLYKFNSSTKSIEILSNKFFLSPSTVGKIVRNQGFYKKK